MSTTAQYKGKRIKKVQGGFHVVGLGVYRTLVAATDAIDLQ